jgi:hypothetical protein
VQWHISYLSFVCIQLTLVSAVYTIFTSPLSSSSRNAAVLSGAFIVDFCSKHNKYNQPQCYSYSKRTINPSLFFNLDLAVSSVYGRRREDNISVSFVAKTQRRRFHRHFTPTPLMAPRSHEGLQSESHTSDGQAALASTLRQPDDSLVTMSKVVCLGKQQQGRCRPKKTNYIHWMQHSSLGAIWMQHYGLGVSG